LIRSLRNSKVNEELVQKIADEVQSKLFDGISTKEIYQMAYKILKRKTRPNASRYKLKKAIMELGPSGFPFEKFIAKILDFEGLKSEVNVIEKGYCLTHEVDVLAKNESKWYIVECKYHNKQGGVNDVKIPLYIHSRFKDIEKQYKINEKGKKIHYQGWIYTNTRFTQDAIQYAKCVGLKLVSWDYPVNKSLKDKINESGLFPLTTITSFTKKEKEKLLIKGLVLCKEIYNKPQLLQEIGIDKLRIKKIFEDINQICEIG
jgi:hypothetical protein